MTAGFRCAPLQRPSGDIAIAATIAPNAIPTTRKRRLDSASASPSGDRSLTTTTTAENPTPSRSAVPVNSQAHRQ